MRLKSWTVWIGVALLTATAACEKASPTRPTGIDTASAAAESVTDARTGATIVAARPSSPAANADIRFADQPVTLTVLNGTTTGSSALTYNFEISPDPGFGQVIAGSNDVPAGAGGSTSTAIGGLEGPRTYFWRVRANTGSGAGPYSAVRSFNIGPPVVLGTPTLASPIDGSRTSSPLSLVINNITRSGPAGAIVYSVQVATDAGFGNVIHFGDGAENAGGGQTTVVAQVSGLVDGTTYYWRARATDTTNGITTPFSAGAPFVVQNFSLANARIWDNPQDLGSWPVGARITSVEFSNRGMAVDFDRRSGPNRWPDVVPPGWTGPIQYNLGMCLFINNEWHCSAVVEFWFGRDLNSTGPPGVFWYEWWYEPARWGPMVFYRPREGEIVGVFAASGSVRHRGFTRNTCPRVCEVTNVVLVPWTLGSARYEF